MEKTTFNVTLAHLGRLSAERELLRNTLLLRSPAHGERYRNATQLELDCKALRAEADTFALFELGERRREVAHALDTAERVLGRSGT